MDIQVSNGIEQERINRGDEVTLLSLGIAAQSDRNMHVLNELCHGSPTVFIYSRVEPTVDKKPRNPLYWTLLESHESESANEVFAASRALRAYMTLAKEWHEAQNRKVKSSSWGLQSNP